MYTVDADGKYPIADTWMDGVWPYEKDFEFYVNPNEPGTHVPKSYADRANGRYGFAFVRSLEMRDRSTLPGEQVTLFPSKNLAWNANGQFSNFSFVRLNRIYVGNVYGYTTGLDVRSATFPGPDGMRPKSSDASPPSETP
ncbi:MAG: hypothetical protein KF784_14210 [Fimbriimonadaceae bacterium]|nr:hypothetical protein [Fimbriimonadaceae bacterium]